MTRNLGIVGCGARTRQYLRQMIASRIHPWRLAALADPNPHNRSSFIETFAGGAQIPQFDDGPALLQALGDQLDGLIIGSPNQTHVDVALPAFEHGLTVLLEKPVAIEMDDLRRLWSAWQQAGEPPVTVGFVLRYTPFYRKVREIIDAGALGRVLTIEAAELIDPAISSWFTRGWRRLERNAGPLLLEACSHDLDIINWFAGDRALRIGSFGSLSRFVPDPSAAMHCRDCQYLDTCRYAVPPQMLHNPVEQAAAPAIDPRTTESDLCVFNSEKNIIDHQLVQIEYANGVLASFSLVLDQPASTRTIRIAGTDGQLFGDIKRNEIIIAHQAPHLARKPDDPIRITIDQEPNAGLYGGDAVIARHFQQMLAGQASIIGQASPPATNDAGLREGINACRLALLAEQSRNTGQLFAVDGWID